ncbi:MAG: hypothetical protein DCE87_11980 [Betaproteobacteria bacterium]|jgi:hypothetical protein|nr:MAG: hypothetical protein DCE87_11980 [Betaproteobacteria bacterium]
MTPEQSIQPINVAAATLLVQVLFLAILGTAGRLHRARRWSLRSISYEDNGDMSHGLIRTTPITFLTLASFTLLLLSDDLYGIWSPLFQGVGISTIQSSTAIFLVYLLNLWAVGFLIFETGGSRSSPFVSALFTIPALTIFLRMPPWAFITIAVLSVLIYLFLLAPGISRTQPSQAPTAFMNIACLVLAMLTGYVTRPVPITEMKVSPIASAVQHSQPTHAHSIEPAK